MAGDDAIYEAAFKRIGVVRVKEIGELFDAATVLDSRKLPRGPKLAIITNAGGPGVSWLPTPLLISGESLPRLSDKTVQELNGCLLPSGAKAIPLTYWETRIPRIYEHAITTCLHDPGIDGILVLYVPIDTAPPEDVARAIIQIEKDAQKPITTAWVWEG